MISPPSAGTLSLLWHASRYKDLTHRILMLSTRASESEEAYHYAVRQLNQVMEGVEKILTLRLEDAQTVTSSSTVTSPSDNEHAEIFLDENDFDNQGENGIQEGNEQESSVSNGGELMNVNRNLSGTEAMQIADGSLHFTRNPIAQDLYTFGANSEINCKYSQANDIFYQLPNILPSQQDSPSKLQLLQAMDLDLQPPNSLSYLL